MLNIVMHYSRVLAAYSLRQCTGTAGSDMLPTVVFCSSAEEHVALSHDTLS